jgi:arylsulfatase
LNGTDHVSRGVLDEERLLLGSRDFATDRWSLFRLSDDFSEARDVADQHPDVVAELEERWFAEAERNQVLPLDDTMQERLAALIFPTYGIPSRATYLPGGGPVHDEAVPPLFGGFTMTADVEVPPEGASGVLCALGDLNGGFVLHAVDGRLAFACSRAGDLDRVQSPEPLPPGRQRVAVRYDTDEKTFTLLRDGEPLASAPVSGDFPVAFQHGGTGLCVGHDRGLPVEDTYRVPARWTGTLHSVVVDTARPPVPDLASEIRTALHSD